MMASRSSEPNHHHCVIVAADGNCRISNNGDSFDHVSGMVWHSEGRRHHMSGIMIMMGMKLKNTELLMKTIFRRMKN